jgi:hypothetical protein
MEAMYRLILALALTLTLAASSSSDSPPPPAGVKAQVSMAASAWVFQYSPNMPPQPSASSGGGWYFDFPSVDGVHYLVTAVSGAVTGTITLNYEVSTTGTPVFDFHTKPNNTCNTPPGAVSLYFQRRGDDITGRGTLGSYRFFTRPMVSILKAGPATLSVPLDPSQWINVWGQNDATGFAAAIADLQAIGMTFGGGCFAGHGVFVTGGTARFIATGYSVQ